MIDPNFTNLVNLLKQKWLEQKGELEECRLELTEVVYSYKDKLSPEWLQYLEGFICGMLNDHPTVGFTFPATEAKLELISECIRRVYQCWYEQTDDKNYYFANKRALDEIIDQYRDGPALTKGDIFYLEGFRDGIMF